MKRFSLVCVLLSAFALADELECPRGWETLNLNEVKATETSRGASSVGTYLRARNLAEDTVNNETSQLVRTCLRNEDFETLYLFDDVSYLHGDYMKACVKQEEDGEKFWSCSEEAMRHVKCCKQSD